MDLLLTSQVSQFHATSSMKGVMLCSHNVRVACPVIYICDGNFLFWFIHSQVFVVGWHLPQLLAQLLYRILSSLGVDKMLIGQS